MQNERYIVSIMAQTTATIATRKLNEVVASDVRSVARKKKLREKSLWPYRASNFNNLIGHDGLAYLAS